MPEPEIQFDQVQAATGPATCAGCNGPLVGSYYQAAGRAFCEPCAAGIRKAFFGTEGGFGRLVRGTLLGIGGGIVGGIAYAIVLGWIHINAALITILIGWLVAKGIRKGASGRGGIGYQLLAVAITYLSIGFFATLAEVVQKESGTTSVLQGAIVCVIGAFVGPVYIGTHSILGAIITLFGLWQAWSGCAAPRLDMTGPHAITASVIPPLPASPAAPVAPEASTPPPSA